MTFAEYLEERLAAGGFSTEDVLASFLPLVRQTIEAHRQNLVAPLEGVAHLSVDGARLWFEEAQRQPLRTAGAELARVETSHLARVEILAESRRTRDVLDGDGEEQRLEIGERGLPVTRPVYLAGYVGWEHEIGHHDPLTDIFSLGLILASLACGLNFARGEDLRDFVEHRRNLFQLRPNLHPVLASAVLQMTELERRHRAQDLEAMLAYLDNYREQRVDFEVDLARLAQQAPRPGDSRRRAILEKLQERLFDMSRRNPLLSFRATLQSVNLTHASVPLVFDIRNIREDQVLVWNAKLQAQLADGKPLSLNKHLNFAEALYLPSLLDRILADARRDQHEYGFAQLRLVICFLSWANLKERPVESYLSPLVLLPVRLIKNKGIRDTYALEPLATQAEVNPVVRHQFRQLYGIELPESVDLEGDALDRLLSYLSERVQASEPGVIVKRIDRPRIDLVHEKARRRLDHFRRSARIAGRGVRTFMDIDYSYDPMNFHPLGLKLFAAHVKTPSHKLREIIEQAPRPRTYMAEPAADTAERERTFFQLRDAAEANPYLWNLDLCSLTLANFRYRKMSLVRDYEAIEDIDAPHRAFDATFSDEPRPLKMETTAPPLAERYDVVPCDPTQASAIATARRGDCYIIQGPPGTGKSQTITNLIADYAARGQRVLFVCEKRAAIDVVYARLKQVGLAGLCCLIHDSQTDKKEFVMDLKDTYEGYLAEAESAQRSLPREAAVEAMQQQLAPLADFESLMETRPATCGVSMRELLGRCIDLRHLTPDVSPLEAECLPPYADWQAQRPVLQMAQQSLRELAADGVLGKHPLRFVQPELAKADRPLDKLSKALSAAHRLLAEVLGIVRPLAPADPPLTLARLVVWLEYASRIAPLATAGQLRLLVPTSDASRDLATGLKELDARRKTLAAAQAGTTAWREKLPHGEVETALPQAKRYEGSLLAWLSPGWWRLRSVLRRAYDFRAHKIAPTWTQVLTALEAEHLAREAEQQRLEELQARYAFRDEPEAFVALLDELRALVAELPSWLREWHERLLVSPTAAESVAQLLAARPPVATLQSALEGVLIGLDQRPLDVVREDLAAMVACESEWPDALAVLADLAPLPTVVRAVLRDHAWSVPQAEAAVADTCWQSLRRSHRLLERFSAAQRERCVERLASAYDEWLVANAAEIRAGVRERFLQHVQLSNLNPSQLKTDAEREWKKGYAQGRRILEHEFGKSMRYKAIRELLDGDSGAVIRDLKPVWLMSPLSVSDTLPLTSDFVDVVIFDEASQVPLEEAVPSLFRGAQVIVVGDEMQLPPTEFFTATRPDDDQDDTAPADETDEDLRIELETSSFLSHAARNLPSTMLGWHYRSRSESLISFSNWAFYEGQLLTVPDHRLPPSALTADDQAPVDLLLGRPLSFHYLPEGVYDKRRNRAEADYIAGLVRDLLLAKTDLTIGVIAFSEAQQGEIEAALERLAGDDDAFREALDAAWQREENGQFVGLLVKNLENIQGDERDVIILSVCYARNPSGKMLMNFGPINKSGGEKRLNVAFSRAKQHMALVSSIQYTAITNDYNAGANCLKNYLRYVEASSTGQVEVARRVLSATARADRQEPRERALDPVVLQIAAALRERGLEVDLDIGESHFRVDLAVRRPGDAQYALGVLVDTADYYRQTDPLSRDMLRPRLLEAFGWRVATILAKDWYDDAASELQRLAILIADERPASNS